MNENAGSTAFKIGVIVLLFATLWIRITWLETIPGHNGDESYEGLQVARMLQGKPFTIFTSTHNILNPFFLALQAPFHYLSAPSLTILRLPAVVSGLAAMAAIWFLGARVLDRRTALIGMILLGVMPAAVVYSRIGHEYSQIPVIGIIAIAFAMRARPIGLAISLAAALLVHPINVFLFPVVVPIYFTQLWKRHACDSEKAKRIVGLTSVISILVATPIAFIMWRRPIVQILIQRRGALNWTKYLDSLEQFFLFQYHIFSPAERIVQSWLFWSVVAVIVVYGTAGLIRERRYERLALIAGFGFQMIALHLLGGPKILAEVASNRYGVILIAPAVLSFACLIRAMANGWALHDGMLNHPGRRRAIFLTAASCLVIICGTNIFQPAVFPREPFPWSFKAKHPDLYKNILFTILRDREERSDGKSQDKPCLIVAEDYWTQKPLEYLTAWRNDVSVDVVEPVGVDRFKEYPGGDPWHPLIDQLKRGGYLVAFYRNPVVTGRNHVPYPIRSAYRSEQLHRWILEDSTGRPTVVIYRLETPDHVEIGQAGAIDKRTR